MTVSGCTADFTYALGIGNARVPYSPISARWLALRLCDRAATSSTGASVLGTKLRRPGPAGLFCGTSGRHLPHGRELADVLCSHSEARHPDHHGHALITSDVAPFHWRHRVWGVAQLSLLQVVPLVVW